MQKFSLNSERLYFSIHSSLPRSSIKTGQCPFQGLLPARGISTSTASLNSGGSGINFQKTSTNSEKTPTREGIIPSG